MESTPHVQLRYQCSPYGANTAFQPVIDELRSSAEFTEDESDDDRLDKLEQLIGETVGCKIDTASPLLAALMSLPVDRYPMLELSPARQKLEAITLLVEQLEALARSNPVIVLVEDVHWIDPSTLEVFDAMVECIPALPVLMVVTHRPEFDRRWQEFGQVTHHSLNRLSRQDGRTLARKVTINKAIPETVLEQILEHTDGVPLFVEELVKTVLESEQAQGGDSHFISANMQSPMAIPTTH